VLRIVWSPHLPVSNAARPLQTARPPAQSVCLPAAASCFVQRLMSSRQQLTSDATSRHVNPAVAREGRSYRLYIRRPTSGRGKKAISHSNCNLIHAVHAVVTLLYRTLQPTVIRRTTVMAADTNFAFKTAAKPLQTETRLLLTAHRN